MIAIIGKMPISTIGPRDVLAAMRKMEAHIALDSVQRVKQVCGQVFRYVVATGSAARDVTQDLKGALSKPTAGHFAAITEPKAGRRPDALFIQLYGPSITVMALKLFPAEAITGNSEQNGTWDRLYGVDFCCWLTSDIFQDVSTQPPAQGNPRITQTFRLPHNPFHTLHTL